MLWQVLLCGSLWASYSLDSSCKEFKRSILYLYRSDFGESESDNDGIHIWAPVISLLGLELDIVDTLSSSFPDEHKMASYSGIIAPTGAWETSLKWCEWLTSQVRDHNRMVLVIAPLGPGDPSEEGQINDEYETIDDTYLNDLYSAIGLSINSSLNIEAGEGGESLVSIRYMDEGLFNFEEDLRKVPTPYFLKMSGTDDSVKSFLTLCWKGVADSDGLAVASTENGGFAIEEYIRRQDFVSEENYWYIDPVKFLISVFRLRNLPVPEPSRIGNSRIISVFVEEAVSESSSARYTQFLSLCEDSSLPVTVIKVIPDIDEDLESRSGVYSVVIDKRNSRLESLYSEFENTLESMADEVFGGRLSGDYRLRLYLDQNLFDAPETADRAKNLLNTIISSRFAPLDETLVARMASSSHLLRHGLYGSDAYFLCDNGDLRQVRSIAGDGYPDLKACTNIIGYKKAGGRLLLHLGPQPITYLKLVPREPEQVFIGECNRPVDSFHFDTFRWIVTLTGVAGGCIEMKGLGKEEKYVCEFFNGDEQRLFEEAAVTSDLSGTATIHLPGNGPRRVEFWSDKDNSYWFVKIRRFFWATGTLPLFIFLVFSIIFFLLWKLTKLIV